MDQLMFHAAMAIKTWQKMGFSWNDENTNTSLKPANNQDLFSAKKIVNPAD